MIRTNNNPMLIAQLSPARSVILKAADSLPFGAPPVISTMLTRASGNPFVIAGGRVGSIARLQDDGSLLPLVRIGDPLPNGKLFGGVQNTTVSGKLRCCLMDAWCLGRVSILIL